MPDPKAAAAKAAKAMRMGKARRARKMSAQDKSFRAISTTPKKAKRGRKRPVMA